MTAQGGITVQIKIGNQTLNWEVYVAPIRDQVLLGLDFLRAADVTIQARGSLYVSGQRVNSQLINQAMSHWATPVRLEKTVVLQPETEYTVWGRNEDPRPDREGVLEPSTILKGVAIAGTLVQMSPHIPVRIANFSDRHIKLKAGTLLGDLVEAVPEGQCRPEPSTKPSCIRRTKVRPRVDLIPEYLQDLQGRASQELDPEEHDEEELASLLMEFADVFAKDDLDVGHFTSVTHSIDTGNARPIRQPPRRTPLGFQEEEEKHLHQMLEAGIIQPSQSDWGLTCGPGAQKRWWPALVC